MLHPKPDRFIALQSRDFRFYLSAQVISVIGSQMQVAAIAWHIYILNRFMPDVSFLGITFIAAAFSLGLVGLFNFVPIVAFSLIGGSAADVYDRKKILIITQSILALLACIMGVLTFTKGISTPWIYLLTFLSALTQVFDIPSRQALLPHLVTREQLPNAISLNSTARQVATIVGPALCGFVIAANVGFAYFINSVSFLFVIAAIYLIHASGKPKRAEVEMGLKAMIEGLVFVKRETIIWSTMMLDFISTFFGSATLLMPLFANEVLHVGPQMLGFLYAAPGIGSLLAGIYMSTRTTIIHQGKLLLISVAFYGAATILFGISQIYSLSIITLMMVGAGDTISAILRNTIRQLATPDYLRGRMTAVNMIFFMGGPQLGEFEGGVLAAAVGGPLSVVIGGTGTVLAVGIMYYAIPAIRKFTVQSAK